MLWRLWFTRTLKTHKIPYKDSCIVTRGSRHRKRFTILLVLVIIAVYCVYWLETLNIEINPKKYINILVWNSDEWYPFSTWKMGRESFIENRCQFTNCYIVHRKDLNKQTEFRIFDAVAFNGREMNLTQGIHDAPESRYDHQKYIFFHTESADNYPVCHSSFDGFFNWTATYKLDSEIVYSYITIKNGAGEEIGPKIDMKWPGTMSNIKVARFNKTRAVAWFVSNCNTRNTREFYVTKLHDELRKLGLGIDIYGACGWLQCRKTTKDCNSLLNYYYFYLSFENSFAEDYVTEKLMAPLQNNNVPIVYGGANYSRFVPPGSYLDAKKLSPKELAATIADLISHPEKYYEYLRRIRPYRYSQPVQVCRLCAALNNEALMERRHTYHKLRRWWHPDYEKRCIMSE